MGVMGSFGVGDHVILNVPDNPILHGTMAKIKELTEWGAHCWSQVSKTNQFRAAWSEMTLFHQVNGEMTAAVEMGYTGDVCGTCGSLRVKRVGACTCCDDCGSSGGCG